VVLDERTKILIGAAAALVVAGCTPPFDASSSKSAQTSYMQCQRGGKACVLKPMTMLVLDEQDPSRDFQFGSWILYDPRPAPGQHYLALMNEANEPICEGYYLSLLINITAPIAMTCFEREGRGKIRFDGLQKDGTFSGETTGTGFLNTNEETVLFVHGATAEEAKNSSFKYLWDKYGGRIERELGARESTVKRVASLPMPLTRSAGPKPIANDAIGATTAP
jgi:hypothetical protein